MRKKVVLFCCTIFAAMLMTGCCLQHDWEEATCKDPKTCAKCGKTEGSSLDHEWTEATCSEPKTCELCGKTKGDTLPHTWIEATCTEPMTCSVCGATQGEAYGHYWSYAYDCTEESYCYNCGEKSGEFGEHYWQSATCLAPETCYYCGATQGEPSGHDWYGSDYVWCWNCGEDIPDNSYVNYELSWRGASFVMPDDYTLYKFDENNYNAFVKNSEDYDANVFMVKTLWNYGFDYDDAIDTFRDYAEEVYIVYDEYESVYGDYVIYVYEVYDDYGVGYCTLFWREDVVVYTELYGLNQREIDADFEEIMESFDIV